MARKRSERTDQAGLFADPATRRDRTERNVSAAILAARKDHQLTTLDDGLASLARDLARAVDQATLKRDPYGVAAASRELREVLARLGLDPRARNVGPADDLAAALRELAAPTVTE